MSKIRARICGKEVILLSGVRSETAGVPERIEAPDKLAEAARRDPDAVAFGYMAGRWIAAA